MSLLTRALPQLADPRPALAAAGQRLTRPVSFIGGTSGLQAGYGSAGPRLSGAEGLSSSAVIYRCVQATTNPLAALEVGVRREAADGTSELDKNHPMAALWNRTPNPQMSSFTLKSIVWQQLELAGESFVYIDRGESGEGPATELWPIYHPVTVVVDKGIAGELAGFVVTINGRKVPLLPSEVLWLRYPHPTLPFGCLAPWKAASWAAELDAHARSWQLGEYVNGARPEGIFYLGDVDEATHNATVEAWRSRHVGARNALKHLFVSGQVKADYTRVGLTAAEMSYIESRKVNAEELMLAFGVHPDLLRGGATFENQRAAKVNLWTEVLLPKLEVVGAEADRQLLPDPAETFEFDTSQVDALQENEDARVQRVQKLMYVDTLMVDEAREIVGMEPLENGAGQYTLTAFRRRIEAQAAIEFGVTAQGQLQAAPPARSRTRGAGFRTIAVDEDHILKLYERHEALGERTVKRLADKQQRVVLRKLKEQERKRAAGARMSADDVFDRAYWVEYTRDFFDTFVSGVWEAGAMTTAGALGVGFDVFDAAVTAAMAGRLDVLAEQVTGTTFQAIHDELLKEGVEAGEGIPKLAERLTSVFDTMGSSRATTIARTETVGGFNAASSATASASGVVAHREWMATRDHRTRETHAELDGYKTKGMTDAYPNGLMHPGDPAGAPGETINCRCVELYAVED